MAGKVSTGEKHVVVVMGLGVNMMEDQENSAY